MLLLLNACGAGDKSAQAHSVTVQSEGQNLTVIFDENSFSSGKIESDNGEYTFRYDSDGVGVRFTVVYPDGFVYIQTERNGGISAPLDYDAGEREAKGYVYGL